MTWELPTLYGGSLKMTLTVPLTIKCLVNYVNSINLFSIFEFDFEVFPVGELLQIEPSTVDLVSLQQH